MARANFRDLALVIRTYDFGEADRIIVLLTREHGLVRGVAKGVRRSKSRFGSRLQPFVLLNVQLYPGRNLYSISGADTVEYFASGIIERFDHYAAASAALEVSERMGNEGSLLFDTLRDFLAEIRRTAHPTALLDSFLLRAMAQAGWEPSLFDCAQCAEPGPHHAFHPAIGGACCVRCRPPGAAQVPEQALHLMWLLRHSEGGFSAATVDYLRQPHLAATAHRLSAAHLHFHLEAKLASLAVLEQS